MNNKKKGIFFTVDAIIALIVILLSILIIYPTVRYAQHPNFIKADVIDVLSSLKVGEIDNAYIDGLISSGKISDPEKSLLEQIGEFYIFENETAIKLTNEVLSGLKSQDNIGIWYNDELMGNVSRVPLESAKNIEVGLHTITGVGDPSNKSLSATTSRAYLTNILQNKYFYYGGYVGEGNITLRVDINGTLYEAKLELVINKDYSVYVNGDKVIDCPGSIDKLTPNNCTIPLGKFINGTNYFELRGETLNVAGGFLKISYLSNLQYEKTNRYYFPGVKGAINVYDGIYIPNNLSAMTVRLNYSTNHTMFLTVGNVTLFKAKGGAPYNETIIDDDILKAVLNYENLVGRTVPLRIGLENVSYSGYSADIETILVTDVSGSMEWCNDSFETMVTNSNWENETDVFCSPRRVLSSDCYPQKIDGIKSAQKVFANKMLGLAGPKVGIVDYSSSATVRREITDLSVNLYANAYNYNCDEFGWMKEDYDDSFWSSGHLFYTDIDSCDNCLAYFRKKFNINNVSSIKTLVLKMASFEGTVCFINGMEVLNDSRSNTMSYFNKQVNLTVNILKEGENLLACANKDSTGKFNFYPELVSDKGVLFPDGSPAKDYNVNSDTMLYYNFDDYFNILEDYSGNNNQGIFHGQESGRVGWSRDGSLRFTDTTASEYVEVPNSASIYLEKDLTISMWVNIRKYKNSEILQKGSGADGYAFWLRYNSTYDYYNLSWGKQLTSSAWAMSSHVPHGEWIHVAGTSDGSTYKIYINGQLEGTYIHPSGNSLFTNNGLLYIGKGEDGTFDGRIDNLIIQNRVLDSNEILDMYNSAGYSNNLKKLIKYGCGDGSDPKVIRIPKNTLSKINLTATIYNSGNRIDIPFDLKIYLNNFNVGSQIGSVQIDNMDSRTYKVVNLNYTAPAGFNSNQLLIAWVDTFTTIPESNENNNNARLQLKTFSPNSPDIKIGTLTYTPDMCAWDTLNTYNLSTTITNIGDADINTPFKVSFYRRQVNPSLLIGSVNINSLAISETRSVSLIWQGTITQGMNNIIAFADSDNVIAESDESVSSNRASKSFSIANPDLRVVRVTPNQTICSNGMNIPTRVTVQVYNYNCPSNNISNIFWYSNSTDPQRSGSLEVPPLGINNFINLDYIMYKDVPTFEMQTTTGIDVKINVSVDTIKNVTESIETNNNNLTNYYAGPDISYVNIPNINIDPSSALKGSTTTFNISTVVKNSQCGPVTFDYSFYRGSVNPGNLLYSQEITLLGTESKSISFLWTQTINTNINIIGVIDSNNDIDESNEMDNTANSVITSIVNLYQQNIFYYPFELKLNPLIGAFLGYTDNGLCTGPQITIFSPDLHIARAIESTSDLNALNNYIDQTDTWGDTCICCGINKSMSILKNSPSKNKFMVVMSDGKATQRCKSGPGNASSDAIDLACQAFNDPMYNITVSAIGFGNDVDEGTLKAIANCGNGSYYYGDTSNIAEIYGKIATELIEASYKEQTINITGDLYTELDPNSYIEFNYTEPEPPYGLILNLESKFTDNLTGNFSVPNNSQIIDAKVTSYSTSRWTQDLTINGNVTYNLTDYSYSYTTLGDPFIIHINNSLISLNDTINFVNLTTASGPFNITQGSEYNKIIYRIQKDVLAYSLIAPFSRGCIWHVQFEDGTTNDDLRIPPEYGGTDECIYNGEYDIGFSLDSVRDAIWRLFKSLDFNNNGMLDIKFTENNLDINSTDIIGVPWHYAIEVRVMKWY